MSEEISLDIAMSKEEMNKLKDLLTSGTGLRHYGIELKNGEYLDLVEYKDYEILEKENEQLKNNWNELKKWLEEQDIFITELPAFTKEITIEHKTMSICYENILDKMQELEGSND